MCFLFTSSCRKGWLEARPDRSQVVPTTLEQLQQLLDNATVMNGAIDGPQGVVPALGELAADNYWLGSDKYNVLTDLEKNNYIWAASIFNGATVLDWSYPYRAVFYANLALEGLAAITPAATERAAWDNVMGSALFFRAHAFYQVAQVFAKPYDAATASQDAGIPLQLSSDPNTPVTRASLEVTYGRIIADLRQAVRYLPPVPLYKTRPSRPAAYALLARTFLAMQDYSNAHSYADSALREHHELLNFNDLDSTQPYPVSRFNAEVLFHCSLQLAGYATPGDDDTPVDSTLARSYAPGDLRAVIFFRNSNSGNGKAFRGSFSGSPFLFAGVTTGELYLIRAECLARMGELDAAMQDINTLLAKRWRQGTFKPLEAATAGDALGVILAERRKELLLRGLRWTDLRRLNREPRFAVTLKRVVNGTTYTLPPGDKRYTLPLPDDVVTISGVQQNER